MTATGVLLWVPWSLGFYDGYSLVLGSGHSILAGYPRRELVLYELYDRGVPKSVLTKS